MHEFSDHTEQAPRFFYLGSNKVALEREQGELILARNKFRQALLTAKPFRGQYANEDDWEHDQEIFADTFKIFEKITDWVIRREHRLKELADVEKFNTGITTRTGEKVVPHGGPQHTADTKFPDNPNYDEVPDDFK